MASSENAAKEGSVKSDNVLDEDLTEDQKYVTYDELTGELVIQVEDTDSIPPSNVPEILPVVTHGEIQEMTKLVIYKDEARDVEKWWKGQDWVKEWQTKQRWEPVESDSDWSDHRSVCWEYEEVSDDQEVGRDPTMEYEDISEDEMKPEPQVPTDDPRNCPCPLYSCSFMGRKLKFHVQHMHLPRIMWDNPQPPVRDSKVEHLNQIRAEVLMLLSECLTGDRSVESLVNWVNTRTYPLVPRRSQILPQARLQMESLCETMQWEKPEQFRLRPVTSPCILIHWRYQVILSQFLQRDQLQIYLQYGASFMADINNLKESKYEYAKTYSLLARVLAIRAQEGQVESDSEDVRIVVQVPPAPRVTEMLASTSAEEETWKVYDVVDTHFHMDRASVRLMGDTGMSVEYWISQQMERPPCVPVNLRGGVVICCDPESYPEMMPVDNKWKIAIGLHPKKVTSAKPKDLVKFYDLIQNPRVTAIGEVGLDETNFEDLREQERFLVDVATWFTPQVPVILHVRSIASNKYSDKLYFHVLELLKPLCHPRQQFILHCFTSQSEIVTHWLSAFPHTYFGFTNLVTKFDSLQVAALRAVPENRLLVETDSPYMPPSGISVNSPIYVGEVLEKLATLRYSTIARVAEQTTANANRVFFL